MLIFRHVLLFGGSTRIGLHALMFEKHIIFLILYIPTAPVFTLYLKHTILAPVSLRSPS